MEVPLRGDKIAYVGRLAPTPTGELHCGHAATFFTAFERARRAGGSLLLRFEDLDCQRCKPQFVTSQMEDLRWLGVTWDGEPIFQSRRMPCYRALGGTYPATFHTALVCDEHGRRLAKRDHATSIRILRSQGWKPSEVLAFAKTKCLPATLEPRATPPLRISKNLVAER